MFLPQIIDLTIESKLFSIIIEETSFAISVPYISDVKPISAFLIAKASSTPFYEKLIHFFFHEINK